MHVNLHACTYICLFDVIIHKGKFILDMGTIWALSLLLVCCKHIGMKVVYTDWTVQILFH